jgi:adenosine deaminase
VAYENVEDAQREGLDYVELRFSPWFMAETHGLDLEGVVEAVIDGVEAGRRDFDVKVKVIGIMSRTYGLEATRRELEALLASSDQIVAVDLAGDEVNWPGELFKDHFDRARDAGWRITVHAGEADGSGSVWQAVRDLGAERIGHGVRSIEDPALLDHLAERRIGIEINLTSNVHTSTVPDYASHPLRSFLDRGLLASINVDSPTIFGIDVRHEYELAAPAAGLTSAHTRQAQKNALATAFLSDEEREALCRQGS